MKRKIYEALADSFDTPKAINELASLVAETNIYMNSHVTDMKVPIVLAVARYVHFVLKSMGIYESSDIPIEAGAEGTGINREDNITPVMNVLCKFRDMIKLKAKEGPKEIF